MSQTDMTLFSASKTTTIKNWKVVDDVVMGGRSSGSIDLDSEGFLVFSGRVSLENNGGFSSVRNELPTKEISDFTHVSLTVRGKPSRYQLRLKADMDDPHAYIDYFQVTDKWETITLKISDFYPTFRGRKLDMPSFPGVSLEQVAFLIANKKPESFKLEIKDLKLISL